MVIRKKKYEQPFIFISGQVGRSFIHFIHYGFCPYRSYFIYIHIHFLAYQPLFFIKDRSNK